MNNKNCKTLMVCIASKQNAANILPVMTMKPDIVVLAVSEEMKSASESLEQWFQTHGYFHREQVICRPGLPSQGIESISEYALELLINIEEQWPEHKVILNTTGGNKLMTLGIVDAFRQGGVNNIIYADTQHSVLEVIEPAKTAPVSIPSVFNIESYLAGNDRIARKAKSDDQAWCDLAMERKPLTKWLGNNIDKLLTEKKRGILRQINIAASRALEGGEAIKPYENQQELGHVNKDAKTVLKKLKEHGVLQWSEDHETTIYFDDEESANYLKGGWLEEYVWHIAQDSNAEYVASGLQIHSEKYRKDDPRNELDLVLVHNNRALLVECKTGQIQNESDIIYKLDSIASHAGGLFCERLLVSASKLDYENRDGRKIKVTSRANSYSIDVLQYLEIKKFRQLIDHWLLNGELPRD
ncbi:Card1-like endonuclease domain-containing protein [Endozoicomonas sp. 2B-B]